MRHTFLFHSSLALVSLIFLTVSAPAAILEYHAEFGAPISSGGSGSAVTRFQLTGPTPTLTGTLNPGDQFRFVYSAPSGSLFSILPKPFGSSGVYFNADFGTTSTVNITANFVGTTVSFVGASGPAPIPTITEFIAGAPDQIFGRVSFTADDFSFKSIVITTTVPAAYSATFTDFSPYIVRFEVFSAFFGNTGSLASLIDDPTPEVPEPATLTLSAAAVGALSLLRRTR